MDSGLILTRSEMVKDNLPSGSALEREWQALAGGFAEGLAKAGSTTASDLSKAGSDFAARPIATSIDFLKNHWQDAAAGAAITFLRPTRWANAALLAYSMKGVGVASYNTFVSALDPKANINEIKSNYANEISHQGTAFLSAMPMALVGGSIGRAGANAVFGKNLGALDLASGKVSLAEVKSNLWNIYDSVKPPKVKLVVTDMDNTLASHGHYFSEGIKKAIGDLAQKTKIPEAELYKSIGQQMENYRSHDYPWSLEIALKDRLKVGQPGGMPVSAFHENIVKPFWQTLDDALVQHHKPYPGVLETFAELKARNIPVVALSDAPAYIGLRRLQNLGLDKGHVERFYGLHNWKEPPGLSAEMLKLGRERVEGMLSAPNGLKELRALPAHFEKPHTGGFEALMHEYKLRPKEVLMIGDSRVKDVGVAHKAGSRAVWASYGQASAAEEAVLTRLRPLPENSGGVGLAQVAAKPKQYAPYLEAAPGYSSLLSHLAPKANYAGLAANAARSLLVKPELSAVLGAYSLDQ